MGDPLSEALALSAEWRKEARRYRKGHGHPPLPFDESTARMKEDGLPAMRVFSIPNKFISVHCLHCGAERALAWDECDTIVDAMHRHVEEVCQWTASSQNSTTA